jgi:hypothetical protein
MANPAKTATSTATKPAKPRAKKTANPAVATPAKARADKPKQPAAAKAVAAPRPKKAEAETTPTKPVARVRAPRKPAISPEQRRRHVELAAYFMAERHGFTPGREYEDWAAAEAEIDRMLSEGLLLP